MNAFLLAFFAGSASLTCDASAYIAQLRLIRRRPIYYRVGCSSDLEAVGGT